MVAEVDLNCHDHLIADLLLVGDVGDIKQGSISWGLWSK